MRARKRVGLLVAAGLFGSGWWGLRLAAAADAWHPAHSAQSDDRFLIDRLHAGSNRHHANYSYLNAVGAVWPANVRRSAVGYRAGTGFLIDGCHVLTNMHVVYPDDVVAYPAPGSAVGFGFGQTEDAGDRGALQGLRTTMDGEVVADGGALILDRRVHDPENDWALIRLRGHVDAAIEPLTIEAADEKQLKIGMTLTLAGYPMDHRRRRGDGFYLKDLWGSRGQLIGIQRSAAPEMIETTNQATSGDSGAPVFADIEGRPHVVIAMAQSIRGNGIDVSAQMPNVQLLFTPRMIAAIRAAQAQSACP